MDIRKDGFYGQLVVSGVGQPSAHRGSILGIISESLKDLGALRARPNADGESEIVIRIRNKPFDTSKESAAYHDKSIEVDGLLDSMPLDQALPDEDYATYHERLMSMGYPNASAMMLACDAFGLEINDTDSVLWLNDPKAVRFRELNFRHEAYDAAIPTEYESLKHYVQATYPFFCQHLTFRTAG